MNNVYLSSMLPTPKWMPDESESYPNVLKLGPSDFASVLSCTQRHSVQICPIGHVWSYKCLKSRACTDGLRGQRVELPHHYAVLCFPRAGASSTLHQHSGDGEERHTGGKEAELVRCSALLQRIPLGPAEHQGPRGAGDGQWAGGWRLHPTNQPPLGGPTQVLARY